MGICFSFLVIRKIILSLTINVIKYSMRYKMSVIRKILGSHSEHQISLLEKETNNPNLKQRLELHGVHRLCVKLCLLLVNSRSYHSLATTYLPLAIVPVPLSTLVYFSQCAKETLLNLPIMHQVEKETKHQGLDDQCLFW